MLYGCSSKRVLEFDARRPTGAGIISTQSGPRHGLRSLYVKMARNGVDRIASS